MENFLIKVRQDVCMRRFMVPGSNLHMLINDVVTMYTRTIEAPKQLLYCQVFLRGYQHKAELVALCLPHKWNATLMALPKQSSDGFKNLIKQRDNFSVYETMENKAL